MSEDSGDKNNEDIANGGKTPDSSRRPPDPSRPVRRPVVGESHIRPPAYSTRKPDVKEAPSGDPKVEEVPRNGKAPSDTETPPARSAERQRLFDIQSDGGAVEPDGSEEQPKKAGGLKKSVARVSAGFGSAAGKIGAAAKRIPAHSRKPREEGDLAPEGDKPRRQWHFPRWARIVVAVIAFWLVATVVVAVGLEIANVGKISKGVRIDGIPVGGLTTSQAVAKVSAELKPLTQPLVFKYKDREFPLGMDTIKVQVQPDAMVSMAYMQGRGNFLPARMARSLLGGSSDVNVPVLYNVDKAQLANFVANIAKTVNADPVSSSIGLSGGVPAIKPSEDGVTVQQEETIKAALTALTKKDRNLEVLVKYKKPEIVDSDISKIVVIQLSQFRLYLYDRTKLLNDFVIACGMPKYPTPTGKFHITYKEKNPTWLPTSEWALDKQGVPQPPGPNNPLGGYWMDLGGGIGIHETPFVKTLGSAASHGCIRMSNEGASTVFNTVNVGTPVFIIP